MVQDDGTGMGIKIQPGGPYVMHGRVPLRRARQVQSEHGEPMTWQSTQRFDVADTVALCRCGGSSTKPFCDGTHTRIGFEGVEEAPTSTYDERAQPYAGTGIVMRDDRGICEHAGFCANRSTNVWKIVQRGATDDSIVRAQAMAMIERCPSGALSFRLTPDGADVEPELAPAIGVVDDGPLAVTGGVPVQRADGQPLESRNRMTLSRCGESSIKPLCDGSHAKAGFEDH